MAYTQGKELAPKRFLLAGYPSRAYVLASYANEMDTIFE
jgi:hypothetical protein